MGRENSYEYLRNLKTEGACSDLFKKKKGAQSVIAPISTLRVPVTAETAWGVSRVLVTSDQLVSFLVTNGGHGDRGTSYNVRYNVCLLRRY